MHTPASDPKLLWAARVEATYRALEDAAIAGVRCPENDGLEGGSKAVGELARAGRITVEIYGHNYRVVVIANGVQVGKRTAAHPYGGKPWKIIGRETFINGRQVDRGASRREEPSKPRDIIGGGE